MKELENNLSSDKASKLKELFSKEIKLNLLGELLGGGAVKIELQIKDEIQGSLNGYLSQILTCNSTSGTSTSKTYRDRIPHLLRKNLTVSPDESTE